MSPVNALILKVILMLQTHVCDRRTPHQSVCVVKAVKRRIDGNQLTVFQSVHK